MWRHRRVSTPFDSDIITRFSAKISTGAPGHEVNVKLVWNWQQQLISVFWIPVCCVSCDLTFDLREQALKKRLALVQDSLNTALSDSSSSRRDNGEQIARLTQAHRWNPLSCVFAVGHNQPQKKPPGLMQFWLLNCKCECAEYSSISSAFFFFTPLQQGLELVQADPQEVSGAGVEAGAESSGDGGEPAAERGSPRRWRRLGVEEGGNSAVTSRVFTNIYPHQRVANSANPW